MTRRYSQPCVITFWLVLITLGFVQGVDIVIIMTSSYTHVAKYYKFSVFKPLADH